MTKNNSLGVALAALLLLLAYNAHAVVIDFDALAPGTPVATIDGVTFSSNIIGYDLVVSTGFDTTSGLNYLGVDDGGFEVFFPQDVVTLTFADAITSLTVNFISSPVTPGEVFSIDTALGSSTSGSDPDSVLGDSGEVFSVSFSSLTPFTSADLTSAAGLYSYNIDDIAYTPAAGVPEPSTMALFGAGIIPLVGLWRRRINLGNT